MKIYIQVKPGSNRDEVIKLNSGEYKVWLKALPQRGKANLALIKILAKYFKVNQQQVKIIIGKTTGKKLIEIK